MSTLAELIAEVKQTLTDIKLKFQKEPMKFGSIATTDGKNVEFEGEMLAVGMPVTIDGAPAPDGSYVLETGMTLVVKDGLAESMAEAEQEPVDMNEQFAAIEQKFEGKFAELKTEFETKLTNFETLLTKITENLGQTLEVVSEFASQAPAPEEKPLNKKQIKFAAENDRLEVIKEKLKNLKK